MQTQSIVEETDTTTSESFKGLTIQTQACPNSNTRLQKCELIRIGERSGHRCIHRIAVYAA